MTRMPARLTALAVLAVAWAVPLSGQVRFEILDLNDLNDTGFAVPYSINDDGVITGTSDLENPGLQMATVWIDGRASALGMADGDHASEGIDTNRGGRSIGHSFFLVHLHGLLFIYPTVVLYENGDVTELETLIRTGENWELLSATDIDDAGRVIGTGRDLDTESPISFLFDDGAVTGLGTLGGYAATPYAMNDAGDIVGQSWTSGGQNHAFLWRDGVMTDLGTFGGRDSRALDINASGWIVGGSQSLSSPERAVLWKNGEAIDLGTLGGPQANANAVNDRGQIVGFSTDARLNAHMFFWEDGVMVDPLDHIPPGGGWGGRANAYDINEAGQFVGTVWREGEGDAPAVLTPVELELTGPVPGRAGETNRFVVSGLDPGERARLVYGGSAGMTAIPGCPGATVLISGPRPAGSAVADAGGTARIDLFVPPGAAGRRARFQAFQRSGCLESNVAVATFD
jgi:probable HAF family extracellular repeat protein